jgi:CheY-like chemotaxis protein
MAHKILVVDDDHVTLEMMNLILQKIGYEPYTSHTIPGALEIIRSAGIDLILLDVQMMPVDGWGFLDALCKDTLASAVPVMLFTARCILPEEYARYGPGVVKVLEKPISPLELKEALDGFFERQAGSAVHG